MPEINDIINNRKANAATAIKKKENLEELERKIRELQRLRPEILKAPGITSLLSDGLEKVNLQDILDIVSQERKLWERIEKRLNRDTINIAVVGLARQGKSTFLQQITLLTDAEIPASDGPPCTTTQSNIYHSPQESYGRVHFHSKSSFLEEVIVPYFKKLGLTSFPQKIEDFGRAQLPKLPVNFSANDESIYNHLKDEYYAHFSDYYHLLKNEKYVQRIRQDEIKEYVSQKYDAASQPTFFHHLAVERVEIFCPFPNRGVEKIAVIDLPGLGDTRLGDAERMIKALAEDTDFILFIRKPTATGDFWGQRDVDLYDAAHQALEDKLPLEQWSFMLLNYDGQNGRACKDFQNTIKSKGIHVKEYLQSNCKNSTSAKEVLTKILTYLERNLVRLDKQYMSSTYQQSFKRQQQVRLELQGLEQAIASYGDINAQYVVLRDKFVLQLYNDIEKFREEKREEFDTPNPQFKAEVDAAINRCQQEFNIPDLERLNSWVRKDGIDAVYFGVKQQMRPGILKNFHLMETGLKAAVDQTKLDLANILIQLGIGDVVKDSELEFFPAMVEILNKSSSLPNLRFAFEFIDSFEVTYKGIIQYRVWQEIVDILPPNTMTFTKASDNMNTGFRSPNTMDFTQASDNMNLVVHDLQKLHQKAIKVCQEILDGLGISFNNGRISMVEEFADYITRAEGVQAEWNIFLSNNRSKVWPELKEMEEQEQLRKYWLSLVQEALAINEQMKLSFS